eukprot:CAMPEP_0168495722 /NCGR_PEP_ID=MMETSP0228-20121227/71890_1 /TAXON_ID=133427 /ORGANISM="Protoceratium reticulatum, Strain CCCM 535 (=CCMP 1889)" /LENGTH=36 /DNA_ID= /DNA_START= /DNA_END= /DNA_ORIENTATION=
MIRTQLGDQSSESTDVPEPEPVDPPPPPTGGSTTLV